MKTLVIVRLAVFGVGVLGAVFLFGCVALTLVEPGRVKVGALYSVEVDREWSRLQESGLETWTVDGPILEAIRFFDAVDDGDPLFHRFDDRKLPTFDKRMTALEVQELVVDTLSQLGAASVQAKDLRPMRFGQYPGYRFALEFLSDGGLELDGVAAGAIVDERLYLILYTGTRIHYFPKYRDAVERLFTSVQTEG